MQETCLRGWPVSFWRQSRPEKGFTFLAMFLQVIFLMIVLSYFIFVSYFISLQVIFLLIVFLLLHISSDCSFIFLPIVVSYFLFFTFHILSHVPAGHISSDCFFFIFILISFFFWFHISYDCSFIFLIVILSYFLFHVFSYVYVSHISSNLSFSFPEHFKLISFWTFKNIGEGVYITFHQLPYISTNIALFCLSYPCCLFPLVYVGCWFMLM